MREVGPFLKSAHIYLLLLHREKLLLPLTSSSFQGGSISYIHIWRFFKIPTPREENASSLCMASIVFAFSGNYHGIPLEHFMLGFWLGLSSNYHLPSWHAL